MKALGTVLMICCAVFWVGYQVYLFSHGIPVKAEDRGMLLMSDGIATAICAVLMWLFNEMRIAAKKGGKDR